MSQINREIRDMRQLIYVMFFVIIIVFVLLVLQQVEIEILQGKIDTTSIERVQQINARMHQIELQQADIINSEVAIRGFIEDMSDKD